ncbi:UNVERIFIED_CONTAM: hypothetical protein H355_012614 [Colinus virginianus]|nr:hypothetical protein H355_012614 [Colinus virginianus]
MKPTGGTPCAKAIQLFEEKAGRTRAMPSASENLQVLSLARNQIKRISGLEEVGQTLRELWLSYNQIEKLDGLQPCVKLEVLYMSNNKIKTWEEVEKLVSHVELGLMLSRA